MKTLIAITLLATAVFAESTSSFEVKELSPEITKRLADSETALSNAMKVLAQAQEDVKTAHTARDKAKAEALNSVGVMQYEGPCSDVTSDKTYRAGDAVFTDYRKLFTRVEIRGKYALVTAGQESCYPSFTIQGSGITAFPADTLHGTNWIVGPSIAPQ